jgi:transposase
MTDHVKGFHRRQQILLPDTVDDYVREDNTVRFVNAFVDTRLDLASLGFTHTETQETGRPSYDPADMLKLYLYGYLNQIRSSRRLERECHRNLELIWLVRKLAPDHKTISDFRKNNVDRIKPVFHELHRLLVELDLIDGDLVGIDGTKLRAVNSVDRSLNLQKLEERLKLLDEKLVRYLKEMDENDQKEEKEPQLPQHVKDLPKKIEKLKAKKALYEGLKTRMAQTGEQEVCLTDSGCRTMKNHGNLEPSYNGRIAVDSKKKLIVAYDIDNNAGDRQSLAGMSSQAKEELGVANLVVAADKGFHSAPELQRCLDKGITPYVPKPDHSGGGAKLHGATPEFAKDKFVYDPSSDSYLCPAGQRLTFSSGHHKTWSSNPEGEDFRYYTTKACLVCAHHLKGCTTNKEGRKVTRGEYEEAVERTDALRETPEGRAMVELRKTLVEHPFGTIKRAFNQGYLLLKGQRKVKGEFGLTCIAYNLRRAINIVGTRDLVARLTTA